MSQSGESSKSDSTLGSDLMSEEDFEDSPDKDYNEDNDRHFNDYLRDEDIENVNDLSYMSVSESEDIDVIADRLNQSVILDTKRFADISSIDTTDEIEPISETSIKPNSKSVIYLSSDDENSALGAVGAIGGWSEEDYSTDKGSDAEYSNEFELMSETVPSVRIEPKVETKNTFRSGNKKSRNGRKDIKEIMFDEELDERTQLARDSEKRRVRRVEQRLHRMADEYGLNDSNEREDIVDSEDQSNRFSHKNDLLNCADSSGRVLINVCHSPTEPDIYLSPMIAGVVKPHQIGGIRFMFDNIIESTEQFDSSEGFGCILSHSMGLGKTLQVIAIVDLFLRHTSAQTVLIVVPVNVLNNWMSEFDKWLPKRYRKFKLFSINKMSVKARNNEITYWCESGGVLLIGYEKFLRMSSDFDLKIQNKEQYPPRAVSEVKELKAALVDPGPGLVVCDEGHRIKNSETGISRALKQIRTKRRVILTGYPLQNKLKEYYCMVDFVRPNYLGLIWEFNNTFERPITNGQCSDSTDYDKQIMRERSHVLNHLLKGFIQRRSESVLTPSLPPKHEFVVLCRLTAKQKELMFEFLNTSLIDAEAKADRSQSISLFKTFVVCSKICNHTDIIYNVLKQGFDNDDLDPALNHELISYSWARPQLRHYEPEVLNNSNKMFLLFEIIFESITIGDKLLVFSQWLFTLDLIERFLESQTLPNSSQRWRKSVSYYRLDGQTKANEREDLINDFNGPNSRAKLFLISTKAGSLGINLIGANRIVLFDACWNPCHDAQAACRVYRYGQSKHCYIYRLISDNTLEKRVFNKQIFKQVLANRVIDEQNIELKLNHNEIRALLAELRKELSEINPIQTFSEDMMSRLDDDLLKRICIRNKQCLTAVPFKHDSLLRDRKELQLNSFEKKKAIESFNENERLNQNLKPNTKRKSSSPPMQPNFDKSYIEYLSDGLDYV